MLRSVGSYHLPSEWHLGTKKKPFVQLLFCVLFHFVQFHVYLRRLGEGYALLSFPFLFFFFAVCFSPT